MDAEKDLSHPDENLLVAFAEELLMPPERQSVMEHLAACLRCREVVFLAQEVTPENPPRSSVEQKPSLWARLNRSLSGPRALGVSAAVALIVAVAIPLMVTYRWWPWTPHALQIASKETNAPMAAAFTDARQGSGRASAAAPASAPARKEDLDKSSAKADAGRPRQAHRTGRYVLQEPSMGALQGHSESFGMVRGMSSAARSEGDTVHTATAPPVPSPSADQAADSQSVGVAAAAPAAAEPAPVESRSSMGLKGGQEKPAVSSETSFRITAGVVVRCQGESCTPRPLPEAATADSTAFFGRTVLALDTGGNLFVSDDQGDHWGRVANQWTGKAHSLRLIGPELSPEVPDKVPEQNKSSRTLSASAGGAFSYSVNAKKDPAAPVFELIDGNGQTWLSSDRGVTWTPEKVP